MQTIKSKPVISIFILSILIAWILFVWLVVTPFYLQKEPEVYKKYGNTLSNYIQVTLKDKPIADYKIPERQASVEIDISKIVKFNWDKAVIYNSSGYSTRICSELLLDKSECVKNDFDELSRSQRYFITFTYHNKVIYKEIFEDEILLFGINTIGRVMTPADSVISAYRDMAVKYRKDDIRKSKYSDLVVLFILPIVGFLFGYKFYYQSLIAGTLLIVPIMLFFMILSGADSALGLVFSLFGPVLLSMITGVGMFVGAILNKFGSKQVS